MNNLQKRALRQAIDELDQAYKTILLHGDKPEFQPLTDRRSKGSDAMGLINSAKAWIEDACTPDA